MTKTQLLFTLLLYCCTLYCCPGFPYAQQRTPVVIGYVGGYKGLINTDAIDAAKLTHINYAFVNIQDGQAWLTRERIDTVNLRKLRQLKQQHPALQVLISIGGWSWSKNFSDAVLTDSSRQRFAQSAVNMIKQYELDGIDIDWEYPGRPGADGNIYRPEDKQHFTLMFQALRLALDQLEKETGHKKWLTTAVGGFPSFLTTTEMDKAQPYLDYINLMTYDYYSGKRAGHHTNLYASGIYNNGNDADKTLEAFIAAGVPASKLVMGIAFYGRTFQLTAGSRHGLGDTVVSQQYGKGYSFLKDSLFHQPGFKRYKDRKAHAPYLFNATTSQFVTYDDEWSVKHKCRYVLSHGMAGVMFWEYDADPKGYLLRRINKTFR